MFNWDAINWDLVVVLSLGAMLILPFLLALIVGLIWIPPPGPNKKDTKPPADAAAPPDA